MAPGMAGWLHQRKVEARAAAFASVAELCHHRCELKRAIRQAGRAVANDEPLASLEAMAKELPC